MINMLKRNKLWLLENKIYAWGGQACGIFLYELSSYQIEADGYNNKDLHKLHDQYKKKPLVDIWKLIK